MQQKKTHKVQEETTFFFSLPVCSKYGYTYLQRPLAVNRGETPTICVKIKNIGVHIYLLEVTNKSHSWPNYAENHDLLFGKHGTHNHNFLQ